MGFWTLMDWFTVLVCVGPNIDHMRTLLLRQLKGQKMAIVPIYQIYFNMITLQNNEIGSVIDSVCDPLAN